MLKIFLGLTVRHMKENGRDHILPSLANSIPAIHSHPLPWSIMGFDLYSFPRFWDGSTAFRASSLRQRHHRLEFQTHPSATITACGGLQERHKATTALNEFCKTPKEPASRCVRRGACTR
jgi:hypothetical protein